MRIILQFERWLTRAYTQEALQNGWVRRLVLQVSATVLMASPLCAQQVQSAHHAHFNTVMFLAVGNGPTPSGALGISGEFRIRRAVTLLLEYSTWVSGLGVECVAQHPQGSVCSLRGRAVLVGGGTQKPVSESVTFYGAVMGGGYFRQGGPISTALAARTGFALSLTRRVFARLGFRYMRGFDREFVNTVGEPVQYVVGVLGLGYRIGL